MNGRLVRAGEAREVKASIRGEGSGRKPGPVEAGLLLISAFVVAVFGTGEVAVGGPLLQRQL